MTGGKLEYLAFVCVRIATSNILILWYSVDDFFRFGANSVEVAHELVKYTDVLLGDLQDSTKRISLFEEKVLEANTCLERAAQIFELHYGTWNKTYQEILLMLL